jgi:hypothetical protein
MRSTLKRASGGGLRNLVGSTSLTEDGGRWTVDGGGGPAKRPSTVVRLPSLMGSLFRQDEL